MQIGLFVCFRGDILLPVGFLGPGGLSPGSTELGIHMRAPDDLEPLLELLEDDDDEELELLELDDLALDEELNILLDLVLILFTLDLPLRSRIGDFVLRF